MEANGCPTPVLMDVAAGWQIAFMYVGGLALVMGAALLLVYAAIGIEAEHGRKR